MLREYTTRPLTVLACIVEKEGEVTKVKDKEGLYQYKHKGKGAITTLLTFTATAPVEPGDAIIMVSDTDISHCPWDVFQAKYNVQGMQIQ